MSLILPISTAVLCMVSFLLMLRDMKDHTELFQLNADATGKVKLLKAPVIVYCSLMFAVTVAASILFCTLYKDNGILMSLKRLALLSLMWPIAYIDFKTYRIPNVFIVFGIMCRVVVLAFELFTQTEYIGMTLLSELIAAAVLLLAAVLCSLCIKNSIGYGDMKLFIVMGLMLSLDGIWGAIFLSLIVSFIISAYVLITKKKTRKDSIPFGPSIVIGTYLSVCLSGM